MFGAVQEHADRAGWLPVYWNIGDEPVGEDVARSAANAEAYRKALARIGDGVVKLPSLGQRDTEAVKKGVADVRKKLVKTEADITSLGY